MPGPLPNRLIFIRHGETEWNREGRLQGQRDVPINPRGRDQAAAAGRLLKLWLERSATAPDAVDFFASPLHRARETMDLVCASLGEPGRPYALDDRLMELSFGRWEGLTWRDVKELDPSSLRARKAAKWTFVPPGGESYAMLAARVATWLDTIERETLLVSHGGVARALMYLLAGADPNDVCDAEIDQGRVLVFEGAGFTWI